MNKKKSSDQPVSNIGIIPMNLVISTVRIQPIATVTLDRTPIGTPIMRDGFITETGQLPESPTVNQR